MPDYSKAKIYKLVCNTTGMKYIGSTCRTLAQRLNQHRFDHKRNFGVSSAQIIEAGNYSIELIEEYPCETKEQLLLKERDHLQTLECINKCKRPIITIEEKKDYYNQHKDRMKTYQLQYYYANKAKISQQQKQYDATNKARKKEYYLRNKDTISEWGKEYYLKKKKQKAKDRVIKYIITSMMLYFIMLSF